jgi:hypothetical protein
VRIKSTLKKSAIYMRCILSVIFYSPSQKQILKKSRAV